jgi:phosphomannomutase
LPPDSTIGYTLHMTTSRNIIERAGVSFGTSGVRGLVTDLNDTLCMAYCLGFLDLIRDTGNSPVALGVDLRPSSPRIAAACTAAIRSTGREVVYCGALPTPALASFAIEAGMPAIMVTGSHIPFDRNGIKFYRREGEISKADEAAIVAAEVPMDPLPTVGPLQAPDTLATAAYYERYLKFFGAGALDGMRVGFYQHSSVARDLLTDILEGLGASVIPLGRTNQFVPIDTEAVAAEDIARAQAWAEEMSFDALISTDGDADRPLIGDERGVWFRGDVVGLLTARALGIQHLVTPVTSTTALERSRSFQSIVRTKVGSPYVLEGLERLIAANTDGGIAGFEANGGFLLSTPVRQAGRSLSPLPTRDAALPIIALLVAARSKGIVLSSLLNGLPARFTASDRIKDFSRENSTRLINGLKSPDAASTLLDNRCGQLASIDETDGLRMTFVSGDIVHLRPSGNAPELRCYVEADGVSKAGELVAFTLTRISASA